MNCPHFKKTGLKSKPEKECLICPLRNEKGDCIKDIMDDRSLEMEQEISEIWRIFYKNKGG